MHTETRDSAWDLSAVIDLIHSLSSSEIKHTGHDFPRHDDPKAVPDTTDDKLLDDHDSKLGDFNEIWKYLGQPLDVPPPIVTLEPEAKEIEFTNGIGNGEVTNGKLVRWRDEVEGADLEDNDEIEDGHALTGLTKAQRKKARMKQRRELDAAKLDEPVKASSASDNDTDGEPNSAKRSAARSAVIHNVLGLTKPKEKTKASVFAAHEAFTKQCDKHQIRVVRSKWPISNPFITSTTFLQPPSTLSAPTEQDNLAVAAARRARLLILLNTRFVDERQFLASINLPQPAQYNEYGDSLGIHIFVDASNILIGFHDALKLSMGLNITTRIRRQPLSFHNLSLILERGRPAAKRVVVGSDNIESMAEARLLGYETSILDRVHKAKELTPRQKRYRTANNNGNTSATTGTSGQSSGSETTAVPRAPEKWVEQAVDEILHLKILESVVDAREPSTIVLATGDAAEAEYSGGFLKMVERALGKGWMVELVSFSHNISGAYKKWDWRARWGERFKIVELDEFAEVLLGVNPVGRG